jgi:hypothetical protein
VTAPTAPPLAPDLVAGLKRLKLARIRAMAPETLQQAKTQRWAPEELLRTLVEAEIAARDAANLRQRRTAAGFPVAKTLEEFKGHCCIWRSPPSPSSTRAPKHGLRHSGLTALSACYSPSGGKRLHFVTRRRHPSPRCNSAVQGAAVQRASGDL